MKFFYHIVEVVENENCYGIHILRANMNFNFINFRKFWQFDTTHCSKLTLHMVVVE